MRPRLIAWENVIANSLRRNQQFLKHFDATVQSIGTTEMSLQGVLPEESDHYAAASQERWQALAQLVLAPMREERAALHGVHELGLVRRKQRNKLGIILPMADDTRRRPP